MCYKYSTIRDSTRSVTFTGPYNGSTADRKVLHPHEWYRFQGDGGTKIPETSVNLDHCGTQVPGWLNGHHPSRESGLTHSQICFHSNAGNSCAQKARVLIRQCLGYYVYAFEFTSFPINGRRCTGTVLDNLFFGSC